MVRQSSLQNVLLIASVYCRLVHWLMLFVQFILGRPLGNQLKSSYFNNVTTYPRKEFAMHIDSENGGFKLVAGTVAHHLLN